MERFAEGDDDDLDAGGKFKCSGGGLTPPATKSNQAVRRWIRDARASLRGRRLYTLFTLVNLLNYMDRGVIPGGSEEFNAFIEHSMETDRPDVFLGILQSGFILGFSIACLIFARLARHRSPFSLMGTGLIIWCAASVSAGLAKTLDSYTFLLVARLLSGVGEASFVTVVPPLITETAPPGERGLWLALFYTAQPVGAGIGYVYGSVLATSRLGWPWAFYLEALMMAPLALTCALVPAGSATAVAKASDYGTSPVSVDGRGGCCSDTTTTAANTSVADHLSSLGGGGGGGGDDEYGCIGIGITQKPLEGGAAGGLGYEQFETDAGVLYGGEGSPLLGQRWGSGEGGRGPVASTQKKAAVDQAASVDWQKCATAEFGGGVGGGEGDCPVMSPDEAGGLNEGWADGRPAVVASLGSLNDGGAVLPVVSVSSGLPVLEASSSSRVTCGGGGGKGERESVLFRDVLMIGDRCVFCLVVLGGAATAAVSAGMSTFGTGFVTSLEFLTSETAAAATFGGVICAAGLCGTPAGGALIDAADPEGRLGDEEKLVLVLTQATGLMCGATVLLVAATAQSSLIPFLFLFFFGGSLLFATSAHSNLAIMLASPKHLRPLSIAVNSILLHALGDVPSPTVIGWMKDAYAPHCVDGHDGGGGVGIGDVASVQDSHGMKIGAGGGAEGRGWGWGESGGGEGLGGVLGGISDACRGERGGLHLTLFVTVSWLLWTCLFFGLARAVQESAIEHGVVPATWGDMRGLIWKGLFRPGWTRRRRWRPFKERSGDVRAAAAASAKTPRPWWGYGWRGRGQGRGRPSALVLDDDDDDDDVRVDDSGRSLEQPLLPPMGSSP